MLSMSHAKEKNDATGSGNQRVLSGDASGRRTDIFGWIIRSTRNVVGTVIFTMGLFLGVLADPMVIESHEIIGKFQDFGMNPRRSDFQLVIDIQDNVF